MLELIAARDCKTSRRVVQLLEERGVRYRYRDYRKQALAEDEIRDVLRRLRVPARDMLRSRSKEYATLGLTGRESDDVLVPLLAKHPRLLRRPIAILGEGAVLARPPERLLILLG
jgi:arsenate reductase (glutaredoxin)